MPKGGVKVPSTTSSPSLRKDTPAGMMSPDRSSREFSFANAPTSQRRLSDFRLHTRRYTSMSVRDIIRNNGETLRQRRKSIETALTKAKELSKKFHSASPEKRPQLSYDIKRALEKAVNEGDPRASFCMGMGYLKANRLDKGLKFLEQAAKKDYAPAHYALARLYANIGYQHLSETIQPPLNQEKAIYHFKYSIRLGIETAVRYLFELLTLGGIVRNNQLMFIDGFKPNVDTWQRIATEFVHRSPETAYFHGKLLMAYDNAASLKFLLMAFVSRQSNLYLQHKIFNALLEFAHTNTDTRFFRDIPFQEVFTKKSQRQSIRHWPDLFEQLAIINQEVACSYGLYLADAPLQNEQDTLKKELFETNPQKALYYLLASVQKGSSTTWKNRALKGIKYTVNHAPGEILSQLAHILVTTALDENNSIAALLALWNSFSSQEQKWLQQSIQLSNHKTPIQFLNHSCSFGSMLCDQINKTLKIRNTPKETLLKIAKQSLFQDIQQASQIVDNAMQQLFLSLSHTTEDPKQQGQIILQFLEALSQFNTKSSAEVILKQAFALAPEQTKLNHLKLQVAFLLGTWSLLPQSTRSQLPRLTTSPYLHEHLESIPDPVLTTCRGMMLNCLTHIKSTSQPDMILHQFFNHFVCPEKNNGAQATDTYATNSAQLINSLNRVSQAYMSKYSNQLNPLIHNALDTTYRLLQWQQTLSEQDCPFHAPAMSTF